MTKFFMIVVLSATLIIVSGSVQAVVYVDKDRSGGNGSSWSQAYRTIESAIAGAGNNQEFWIAEGTYTPASVLAPKNGSKFYGGFAGTETALSQRDVDAHPVIVDGQNSLKHVFLVDNKSGVRIDGLTITRGKAIPPGTSQEEYGGGISVWTLGAEIVNCKFVNNSSSWRGGGLFIKGAASLVDGCQFTGNTSASGGGACLV